MKSLKARTHNIAEIYHQLCKTYRPAIMCNSNVYDRGVADPVPRLTISLND